MTEAVWMCLTLLSLLHITFAILFVNNKMTFHSQGWVNIYSASHSSKKKRLLIDDKVQCGRTIMVKRWKFIINDKLSSWTREQNFHSIQTNLTSPYWSVPDNRSAVSRDWGVHIISFTSCWMHRNNTQYIFFNVQFNWLQESNVPRWCNRGSVNRGPNTALVGFMYTFSQ